MPESRYLTGLLIRLNGVTLGEVVVVEDQDGDSGCDPETRRGKRW
jgi:hypothetical protein